MTKLPAGAAPRSLNVLVIDDSAVVRQALTALLSSDRRIHVTTAPDPIVAQERMRRQRPDVIVLDLEMPRMDGLSFLRKLMAEGPIPVVVCSALTGTQAAIRALQAGAVEVVPKPQLGVRQFLEDSAQALIGTIRGAAGAQLGRRRPEPRSASGRLTADAVLPLHAVPAAGSATSERMVVVAASTGGVEALTEVLGELPSTCPGLVVVQHMPERFTEAFANRLNEVCRIEVREAKHGDRIAAGRALIAPGNRHTLVVRSGGSCSLEVRDGPPVRRHRPSADVLFRSAALAAGPHALGVIMTGMGDDGAAGLLEMKQAGATTVGQDEATSVVFGMPKEAIARGAVDEVVPLQRLAATILRWAGAPVGPRS